MQTESLDHAAGDASTGWCRIIQSAEKTGAAGVAKAIRRMV